MILTRGTKDTMTSPTLTHMHTHSHNRSCRVCGLHSSLQPSPAVARRRRIHHQECGQMLDLRDCSGSQLWRSQRSVYCQYTLSILSVYCHRYIYLQMLYICVPSFLPYTPIELPYNDYFEYYGPDFKLHISPTNMTNQNTPEYLNKIKSANRLRKNFIDRLQNKVSILVYESVGSYDIGQYCTCIYIIIYTSHYSSSLFCVGLDCLRICDSFHMLPVFLCRVRFKKFS